MLKRQKRSATAKLYQIVLQQPLATIERSRPEILRHVFDLAVRHESTESFVVFDEEA